MKKLSITVKITIWYTLFLVVIATGIFAVLVESHGVKEEQIAKNRLAEVIADRSELIEHDGETFVFDQDMGFYEDETYISTYDENGRLIVGRRPDGIAEFPELNDKQLTRIEDKKGREWYIYDSCYEFDDNVIWIRGIMNNAIHDGINSFTERLFTIFLPLVILLAAIGGWIITRRAFKPVREIVKTADEIKSDGDFSRRIPSVNSNDEIAELTRSVNEMFGKVEETLDREKQYTNEVSHEIRTPLSVILTQSEYGLENPDYRDDALKVINKQARQLSNMVSKVLTLSRSDAGRLRLEKEDINFSEILEDIAEQQQLVAEEYDITIRTDIEKDIHIIADEGMLIRVVLNLISNGIKYGKNPGGIITLGLSALDGNAVCIVADNGPGIANEERNLIWQRFYQGDASRNREDSTGLGLSMVESLTHSMGGSVRLMSQPIYEDMTGATFELIFPTGENE